MTWLHKFLGLLRILIPNIYCLVFLDRSKRILITFGCWDPKTIAAKIGFLVDWINSTQKIISNFSSRCSPSMKQEANRSSRAEPRESQSKNCKFLIEFVQVKQNSRTTHTVFPSIVSPLEILPPLNSFRGNYEVKNCLFRQNYFF